MQLTYKKVNRVAKLGNTERSKVLRLQWAKAYLNLPEETVLCNIDETMVNKSDWRKCKWQPRGQSSSVVDHRLNPRITLITAVDTLGNVWIALAQANSSRKVFSLFLRYFT